MADVGLDRTNRQRSASLAAKDFAEGGRLDRIANASPCPMRLDIGIQIRSDAGASVDGSQELDLIVFRRQGNAACTPIRINGAAANNSVNSIAVLDRFLQRFQDKNDAALRANIAVRLCSEGPAQAGRREHGGLRENDKTVWTQKHAHTADQGGVNFAPGKRVPGFMKRHEGG